MGTMKVEIISRDTIKPSTPTPPHLRNYTLSLLDRLSNCLYIRRVLFYTSNGYDRDPILINTSNKYNHLKNSLSQILTKYYPFAGRLNDINGLYIECNDEGVDILEARIDCKLYDFLKNPNLNSLQCVFPSGLLRNKSCKDSLVVVQVSFFDCGGMAIGVCMVHKIADGCTISTFLSAWASMARQSEEVSPHFITSCLASPPNETFTVQQMKDEGVSCITRRFVFNASKIANLKAMASSDSGVNSPTRVVTVIALLHKCAMAASREKSGSSRPSLLIQTVNMRPKMVPSLPENSVGNFSWHYTISVTNNIGFQGLVSQVREGMTKFNEYAKNYTMNEWFLVVRESLKEAKELYDSNMEIDIYTCISMCRNPFYEVDFGWGKPIWVAIAGNVYKNTFALMNTRKGDGIEAWVTLDEQEMALFECNEELLAFASLNPSVLDTD